MHLNDLLLLQPGQRDDGCNSFDIFRHSVCTHLTFWTFLTVKSLLKTVFWAILHSSKILTIQQGQPRQASTGFNSGSLMAEISWSTSIVFLIKCAGVWQNAEVAWFTLLYRQNFLKVQYALHGHWRGPIGSWWVCFSCWAVYMKHQPWNFHFLPDCCVSPLSQGMRLKNSDQHLTPSFKAFSH